MRDKGVMRRPFDYIPSHMHHMIFEIMKNSMRATMEQMAKLGKKEPEPVNVIISHGENDITIKVRKRRVGDG